MRRQNRQVIYICIYFGRFIIIFGIRDQMINASDILIYYYVHITYYTFTHYIITIYCEGGISNNKDNMRYGVV